MTRLDHKDPIWPRWAVGPIGNRALFYCLGDIPAGWVLEAPLPTEDNTVALLAEELANLREEYRVAFGGEPNPEWDAATIRHALSGGNTPPPNVHPDEADRVRSLIPATSDPDRINREADAKAPAKFVKKGK